MTVENQLPPTTTAGDGSTVTFPYNFKIQDVSDLDVTQTIVATGEDTTLEIVSSTGIGDPAGGTVTFASAPPAGSVVSVDNKAPISQPQEFDGNDIYPKSVEDGLDRKTIENQRQQSEINRTLRLHVTDSEAVTLPHKSIRADALVGFDATGEKITMVKGAAASQAYVDQAEAQADRAVAAATYPYTSGEQKTGAFMPGAGESLTLFTYNNVSDAAVTLPALSGLAAGYNIGICRTAGSGDLTISAADSALINGAASAVLASDYLCLDLTINEAGDEWVATDKALIGLPIGTNAGDIVVLDNQARLPNVDGSQLSNVIDRTSRDTSITAFVMANIVYADNGGVYGDLISDNFTSDTLAVSDGAVYNATDDYYANSSGNLAIGETATASSVTQSAGRAIDGNQSTCWTSNGDDSAFLQIEFASPTAINKLTLKSGSDGFSSLSAAQIRERHPNAFTLEASATGAFAGEEVVLVTEAASFSWSTVADEARDWDFSNTTEYSYYRLSMTGKQRAFGATYEYFLGEIELRLSGQDMTLQPVMVPLESADPSDISTYFRVEDIDAVTNGTDRVVEVSIDNGATWSTCDITQVGAFGSDDNLIRADGDVSAQSGSSFVWRLTTSGGKQQRVKQVVSVPSY